MVNDKVKDGQICKNPSKSWNSSNPFIEERKLRPREGERITHQSLRVPSTSQHMGTHDPKTARRQQVVRDTHTESTWSTHTRTHTRAQHTCVTPTKTDAAHILKIHSASKITLHSLLVTKFREVEIFGGQIIGSLSVPLKVQSAAKLILEPRIWRSSGRFLLSCFALHPGDPKREPRSLPGVRKKSGNAALICALCGMHWGSRSRAPI